MPRKPTITLFDLVDDMLDQLATQARASIRAAIRDSGLPTQLPGPAPAQNATQPRQKRARTSRDSRQRQSTSIPWVDYYGVLEVSPSASQETITGAYRALARKYHPDVHKGKRAEDRMRAINEAYSVLGEPAKRLAYDRERKARQAK